MAKFQIGDLVRLKDMTSSTIRIKTKAHASGFTDTHMKNLFFVNACYTESLNPDGWETYYVCISFDQKEFKFKESLLE